MNIWIINPYGNLPGEGWSEHRSTFLANAAIAKGHRVTWWVSNFEHRSKRLRSYQAQDLEITSNFRVKIVPSTPYSGHVSLARIKYERTFAWNLVKIARTSSESPDIVVHGEPAVMFSDITARIIDECGARLVIDVMDLWPELFAIRVPGAIRPLNRVLFAPLYWRRAMFFRKADGFLAVASDYLELANRLAPGRPGRVVYWGTNVSEAMKAINPEAVGSPVLSKPDGEFWCVYAGTLGENYDIRSIIGCAKLLQAEKVPIRILIAGDGVLRGWVERSIEAEALRTVTYLGRLDARDLRHLYRKCDCALSTYVAASTVSMPIKAFDYLTAGLPLVNSLAGDLRKFILARRVGLQYSPEDPAAMYRALVQLWRDPGLRGAMATNAKNLAQEFDLSRQYPQAVELLEAIAAMPSGRSKSAGARIRSRPTQNRP